MSDRKWCPSQWLDETAPVLVSNPNEALCEGADGTWYIVQDDAEDDPDQPTIALVPGQVVAWCYTETRGEFVVTRREDGSYVVEGGEIPADATAWWVPGDSDTVSDNLDNLVSYSVWPEDPQTVEAYFWSNDISLRFEIVDGKGQFLPPQSAGAH